MFGVMILILKKNIFGEKFEPQATVRACAADESWQAVYTVINCRRDGGHNLLRHRVLQTTHPAVADETWIYQHCRCCCCCCWCAVWENVIRWFYRGHDVRRLPVNWKIITHMLISAANFGQPVIYNSRYRRVGGFIYLFSAQCTQFPPRAEIFIYLFI